VTQPNHLNSAWTPEKVEELRRLAATTMLYRDIAKALGMSKSAVCGKVRRLKVARPNEVTARGTGGYERQEKARPRSAPIKLGPLPAGGCLWPLWDHERPTHRYCDAKRKEGRPYCRAHCATAYERPKAKEAA
jgi:GcrA cell cycle regulator